MIRYSITSHNPSSHNYDVTILIDKPDPEGQQVRLPNWLPGSYMIRDFSRHIIGLQAKAGDSSIAMEQIDKSNWRIAPTKQPVTLSYRVYAKDFSVRAAHLDHSHAYYNGSSVFLEVVGQAEKACEVLIEKPKVEFSKNWKLATSLARKTAKSFEFGLYQAEDYDDLIDHPVEMGEFLQIHFEACGVPHDIILTGRLDCDEARLAKDLKTICEHHLTFFGNPLPIDYYQFQVLVVGDGYGGLEHRGSTSLICTRDSLPKKGQPEVNDDYRQFLGLCSHEYFHTWNIKRIKPQAYQPYDLQQEVYSDLLWAFEGITSYYDDLALVRCGLIDQGSYLELLAQTMTRVRRGIGRKRQSAAESSFNTWTKFYKQDENAANAIVSYYSKGCLIALCIDLKLRELSNSKYSLDDVMRRLWQDYSKSGKGIQGDTIQKLVSELAGSDLTKCMDEMIHGVGELPLTELLAQVDLELVYRVASNQQDKGGKSIETDLPRVDFGAILKQNGNGLKILRMDEACSAQSGGLAAGDVIIAIDGLKANQSMLDKKLLLAQPSDKWKLHAFRRDELYEFEVKLQQAQANTIVLKPAQDSSAKLKTWMLSSN